MLKEALSFTLSTIIRKNLLYACSFTLNAQTYLLFSPNPVSSSFSIVLFCLIIFVFKIQYFSSSKQEWKQICLWHPACAFNSRHAFCMWFFVCNDDSEVRPIRFPISQITELTNCSLSLSMLVKTTLCFCSAFSISACFPFALHGNEKHVSLPNHYPISSRHTHHGPVWLLSLYYKTTLQLMIG